MPTNLATNFNPSDSNLGGLLLPDGTKRHDEALNIVDEITTVGSASFGRVTASSPTPTGIQSYAGSLSPGGTSYIDRYSSSPNGTFDALYFKADPALGTGDKAVMFGLMVFRYALGLILADPVTNSISQWNETENAPGGFRVSLYNDNNRFMDESDMLYRFSDRGYSSGYSEPGKMFFSRLYETGNDSPSGNESLEISHRFWCFCADEYLVWKSVLEGEKDRTSGLGMIWLNPPPSDGHYSRAEVPAILARTFRRFDSNRAIAPAHQGNSASVKVEVRDEIGFIPNGPDTNGRELIFGQRAFVNDPLSAHYGLIPGLRVVRDDAIAVWDTVTINGDNWVCLWRDSGRGYLTRYENSK
jgi:hypothetical protein